MFLRHSLHEGLLGVIIIITHFVLMYGCGPSEYQSTAGECCPMCSIGQVVYRDCSGDSSTTCKPCYSGTFMNQPNGFNNCFQCKTCDNEQGLYVSRPCNTISDTVCDVLDGYHCKDYQGKECTFALKHRRCRPAEEIKIPGTKDSDTVCVACPPGSYSPLGVNCTKWTDCSAKGEIKDKEGSSTEDVQCKPKKRGRYGLIAAAVLSLPEVLWLAYSYVKQNFLLTSEETSQQTNGGNHTGAVLAQTPTQETVHDHSTSAAPPPSNVPEETREEDLLQP
ncbi:hypothetical protein MHYP_G00325970 [Metynnis hypsauchen]